MAHFFYKTKKKIFFKLWRLAICFCLPLVSSLEAANYVLLRLNDNKVMEQRNSQIEITPSSLIKPFVGIYFMQHLAGFSPEKRLYCQGWQKINREVEHACWYKPGHRFVSLHEALAQSCNHFFYQMAEHISLPDLYSYLRTQWRFGSLRPGRSVKAIIGEDVEGKITLSGLLESYRMLYKGDFPFIKSALHDSLTKGTLQKFYSKFVKEKAFQNFKILYGKTGTSADKNATVVLFFRLRQFDYLLIANKKGLMASKFAEDELLPLMKKWVNLP